MDVCPTCTKLDRVLERRQRVETVAKGIAIYHCVHKNEDFDKSAQDLFDLVRGAQKDFPGKPRCLYLDIEGHKNKVGGYDSGMAELQTQFLQVFLMPFLTEAHIPLLADKVIRNTDQKNNIPDRLDITPAP